MSQNLKKLIQILKNNHISDEEVEINDIQQIYNTIADVEVEGMEEIDLRTLPISNRTLPVLLRSMLHTIDSLVLVQDKLVK